MFFLPHVIYLLSHNPSNEKNETYRSLIKRTIKQKTNINSKSQQSVILLVRFEKRKSIDQGVNLIYLI